MKRTRVSLLADDIFISYSREDCSDYALALAKRLMRRNLSCSLDLWGTPAGREIPEEIKARIRGSSFFVLLGSGKATESEFVLQELEIAIAADRKIIPITFVGPDSKDSTLERADWYERLIQGMPLGREDVKALEAATPSRRLISRIITAVGFMSRYRRLWRWAATIVIVTTAVLLAGTAAAGIRLHNAEIAIVRAEQDQRNAELERNRARVDQAIAEQQAREEQDNAQKAIIQRQKQERLTAEAKLSAEGARVSVIAQGYGHEMSALEKAVQLMVRARGRKPPQDVRDGLIDALVAAKYSLPLSADRHRLNNATFVGVAGGEPQILLVGEDGAEFRGACTGQRVFSPDWSGAEGQSVAFSPDRSHALTVNPDGKMILWNTGTGEQTTLSKSGSDGVKAVLGEGGSRVVTWEPNSEVAHIAFLWNGSVGMELVHDNPITAVAVAVSKTGSLVVTAGHDGAWQAWDGETGKRLGPPRSRGRKEITSVAISPNQRQVATGDMDGWVRLWDAQVIGGKIKPPLASLQHEHGNESHEMGRGFSGTVMSVSFSPDGELLLTASTDHTARLLSTSTFNGLKLREVTARLGHPGAVEFAKFSSDGTVVLTASKGGDDAVRLWDRKNGMLRATLRGHRNQVRSAEISLDNTRVVTVASDGVRLWDVSQDLYDYGSGERLLFLKNNRVEAIRLWEECSELSNRRAWNQEGVDGPSLLARILSAL